MARYTGAVCRQCRREGKKLFLKGERCYTDKCAVTRRASAPGQHGKARKKVSEYGTQLRAKQSARRYYGVLESQLAHYFELAAKQPGITGENLLRTLETRLDNVVYRMGFALSRKEARQLVLHRHFTVNGERVNIASYLCKAGDEIAVAQKSKESDKIKIIAETNASKPIPAWLSVDKNKLVGTIVHLPVRDEIDLDVEEHLIVEYYSK